MAERKFTQAVRGQNAVDGAGVHLRRVLGYRTIRDFDPFLMLDGFDSKDPADYIKGFPWHPHRGIETVTYLLKGDIEHGDSLGNKGVIGDLQCQWMTASSSDSSVFDEVKVKAGPEGARFFLIAARPLQEPVAWGGPIVMNTQEELNLAFSELESKTFIKHDKPLEF